MYKMEYVRGLHANYGRIQVEYDTDGRYQYCMLDRGGIAGLLDCSTRNVDGNTYLYYDITSRQTISQLYQTKCVDREWVLDFLASIRALKGELYRFLLDEENIVWDVEQIYQEVDRNRFSYVYIPYLREGKDAEAAGSFLNVCSFLVEHMDYNDTKLVDFVYRLYDQTEKNGAVYLQGALWQDVEQLEKEEAVASGKESQEEIVPDGASFYQETPWEQEAPRKQEMLRKQEAPQKKETPPAPAKGSEKDKKSIKSLFDIKRKKEREEEERQLYQEQIRNRMENLLVAEPVLYDEEEKTTNLSLGQEPNGGHHYILNAGGMVLQELKKSEFTIGKAKDKVDLCLEDLSVSRLHCRILREKEECYLEDMNSTNSTWLNDVKLAPYQWVKLAPADEIKCGNVVLIYR